jgi:dihydroorotate dehydrogenase (fumarate)
MKLNVKYLGLDLKSPVIAASSPFTATEEKIRQLEERGIGAVVLKSVFEEQIIGETEFLERYNDYPEAADYLRNYVQDDYLKGHLNLIENLKRHVSVPVIASINCNTAGAWTDYAKRIESAGADALELNIFLLPTNPDESARQIEERYLATIDKVVSAINIPVSIKLGVRFTNLLNIAREIYFRKAKGIVMFNRFFEPDIDVESMSVTSSDPLSSRSELRNILRSTAMCASHVKELDLSATTGVHNGEDVVKALLAGAKTVQICTALYTEGVDVITSMNTFVAEWMDRNNFDHIEDFRGRLAFKSSGDEEFYQRAQYMKFFPKA